MDLICRARLAALGVLVLASGVTLSMPLSTAAAQNLDSQASPLGSSADSPCARSELPVPAWATSPGLMATDPSGRYQVGDARDADDQVHLLRWDDGVVSDLATGGLAFGASDVNARGEIAAGDYDAETGRYIGLRYRDGEFVELPVRAPFTDARPSAINGAGQITGRLDDPETSGSLPAVWSADNELTVLEMPGDRNTITIQDIDEDGTVLGTVWYDDGNTNLRDRSAIVWYPDGTWRLLPGLQPDAETSGTSIRFGHVLGVQAGSSSAQILQWNAQTGDVSALRDGIAGLPLAVNARGSVIGYVDYAVGPVLLPGDTTETRLLPTTDPVIGSGGPNSLTDDDVAYGNDSREDGTSAVIRWDCRG